jgi:hypothetical protein
MALGFVERTVNGHRALVHGGDIFSFQSGLFLLPDHDVGLFVSYSGGGHGEPLTLFHEVVDGLFPGAPAEPPSQDGGAASRARAFSGAYHANRRSYSSDESLLILMEAVHVRVEEDGFLTASVVARRRASPRSSPGCTRRCDRGTAPSPTAP